MGVNWCTGRLSYLFILTFSFILHFNVQLKGPSLGLGMLPHRVLHSYGHKGGVALCVSNQGRAEGDLHSRIETVLPVRVELWYKNGRTPHSNDVLHLTF